MKEVAVQGTLTSYRSTVDGGIKLTVELDELQAFEFRESFPGIGSTVAVAPLRNTNDGPSEAGA
jgi:hypothetical protein